MNSYIQLLSHTFLSMFHDDFLLVANENTYDNIQTYSFHFDVLENPDTGLKILDLITISFPLH